MESWYPQMSRIIPITYISNQTIKGCVTFSRHHGDDLKTDVFLHLELKLPEASDHFGDLLHHVAHILVKLVHRDRFPHHLGQAGLQRHQVGRHLVVEKL